MALPSIAQYRVNLLDTARKHVRQTLSRHHHFQAMIHGNSEELQAVANQFIVLCAEDHLHIDGRVVLGTQNQRSKLYKLRTGAKRKTQVKWQFNLLSSGW